MLRLTTILFGSMLLVACATSAPPVAQNLAPQSTEVAQMTTDLSQTPQESRIVQPGVQPCPRFLDSISRAEAVLRSQHRDYVHML